MMMQQMMQSGGGDSMMGMMPMGGGIPDITAMDMGPKDILTFKRCCLYPPPPNAPGQSRRDRPPGCRTIFIGGCPDNVTEEILQEIFESCGSIVSIRISRKNF